MNLYFRLFLLFISRLFRKKPLPLSKESALSFVVLPADIDLNWHVNNGRYLAMMDLGRLDLIDRVGVLRPAIRRRWAPIIGDVQVRYVSPLKLLQRFTLYSKITHWDDKWFYFEHRFVRSGRTIATAHARGLMRGVHGNIRPADVLKVVEGTRYAYNDSGGLSEDW